MFRSDLADGIAGFVAILLFAWPCLVLMPGCGGSAASDEPELGWCCEGLCGLWASEAAVFGTCTCEGAETASGPAGRGECVPRLD